MQCQHFVCFFIKIVHFNLLHRVEIVYFILNTIVINIFPISWSSLDQLEIGSEVMSIQFISIQLRDRRRKPVGVSLYHFNDSCLRTK